MDKNSHEQNEGGDSNHQQMEQTEQSQLKLEPKQNPKHEPQNTPPETGEQ